MRKIIQITFLILIFGCAKISAQKVYYTKFKNDADLVIYITKDKSKADLIVKKVSHGSEVMPGFWREVKLKVDSDLIVYISKQNTIDIKKVYFTKFEDEVRYKL